MTHKLGELGKHETLNTIEPNSDEENVSDVVESATTSSSSALTEVERVELERVTSEHAVERRVLVDDRVSEHREAKLTKYEQER